MAGGSTTRRGGRQKGTPNKATVEKERAKQLGVKALEALMTGDGASIADVRKAIESNEHAIAADAAEGTLTEADAMIATALKENKHYPTALSYLQDTYRDPRLPRMIRQDAAKAAIRYETPALSNVAVQQEPDADRILREADNRKKLESVVSDVLRKAGVMVPSTVTDIVIDDRGNEIIVTQESNDDVE